MAGMGERTTRRAVGGGAAALALAVLLAACGGGSGDEGAGDGSSAGAGSGGGVAAGDGPWSFTDDRGEVIELDEVPDTIVGHTTTAGGLWEYGIEVAGVFGPLARPDGTPDPGLGNADPDDFTSVGETEGRPNVEAIAATDPDIVVVPMWGDDTYWGIEGGLVEQVEAIAPIVGIRVEERGMDEPLGRMAELAESLGADPATVEEGRAAFEEASDRLAAAVEGNPGLRVLAASGSESEMFVAYPPAFPDLRYYQSLGLDIVEPTEHPEAAGAWQSLSWEQADTYPADMILADVRFGSVESLLDMVPDTLTRLPAVEADQLVAWPAAYAIGYGNVAEIVDDLAAAVEGASPDIVD
jgi:iron complex transport system substrate-binding protein